MPVEQCGDAAAEYPGRGAVGDHFAVLAGDGIGPEIMATAVRLLRSLIDGVVKFEHARKLPVTGQMSDRLVRELTAMTGHPID